MQTFITTNSSKHLFSFFYPYFKLSSNKTITISDKPFCQRLLNIVRLKEQDQCVLFSETDHLLATIESYDLKKQSWITFSYEAIITTPPLEPTITLYIALAKKTNWSEILYAAAQLGVTTVQPIITERAKTELLSHDRMQQIMIAGCEQAKQYKLPTILEPIKIDKIKQVDNVEYRWYADPEGAPCNNAPFFQEKFESHAIAIGPEAGFTQDDQIILEHKGFKSHQLTPTILRTIDATPLALGIIRTFCKQ